MARPNVSQQARQRTVRRSSARTSEAVERAIARYMRAAFHKMGKEGQLTSAHNYGHVSRVAMYAKAYVKLMGGGKAMQAHAGIVGYSHDRFRNAEQSIGKKAEKHEGMSAKYMKPMLDKRLDKKTTAMMFEAMAKHGELPELNGEAGRNLIRDGLVFADKFFEANGAYIAFRRSLFMGERAVSKPKPDGKVDAIKKLVEDNHWDLNKPKDLQEAAVAATLMESKLRIEKLSNKSSVPVHLHPFLDYQVKWQHDLVRGLETRDPGIVNLATQMFAEGLKEHPRDLEIMIKEYKPITKSDADFKKETMGYLRGDLAKKFQELVKRPKRK